MKKRKLKNFFSFLLIFALSVCVIFLVVYDLNQSKYKSTYKTDIAMGTVITQTLYSKSDMTKTNVGIEDTVSNLEKLISWRLDTSYTYALNETTCVDCSEEIKDMFKVCLDLNKRSSGNFDITVGKLSTLWNIGEENAKVPSKKEIKSALKYVDGSKMNLKNNTVCIEKGQFVDLGAVGKGFALDEVRDYLKTTDTFGAVVSVGGSVLLYGTNPESETWTVGIRDPKGSASDTMGEITLGECCVSTSGNYEKILEKDGKTYHHILSPKTGYPAQSGLVSVTVVCDNGLLSDALSTACFVCGKKDGLALLKHYGAEGIFIDEDNNVTVTDGLKDSFEITNNDYKSAG